MKTLSLRLPDELAIQLGNTAQKRKTTRSEVVRSALEGYLGGPNLVQKGSVLELAGHLIGSLKGPGDLSYNKSHLQKYGT